MGSLRSQENSIHRVFLHPTLFISPTWLILSIWFPRNSLTLHEKLPRNSLSFVALQICAEQGMEIAVQYQPPATKIPFDTNNKFNVFLSFRGKDVRTTFVDHLYESFSGEGLKVFLDSEELEKGKEIDSNLQEAIKTCDILIPIFSKHYAESTWCLKEAAQMWRSNGFIIPLFYDVEPSDVRYPQREGGPFAKAFQKHYSHLDQQDEKTVEEWKNVLQQISSLSGWTRAEEFG